MTSEEMKELKGLAASMGLYDDRNPCKRAEILGKAIKELEKEPCEDAISRLAAIDIIESWLSCDDYNEAERHIMRATQSILKDLPSVTPAEKVGHWIANGETFRCSECGELSCCQGRYCNECGRKMQEVMLNDT